jgi:prepilin-type N-terminal cleavage/methylation domain-containing protein
MKTCKNQPGFSLTEIIIAMAIFSLAAVSLLGVLPVGLNGIRNASRSSEAVNVAQAVFADLQMAEETGQWPSERYGLELPLQGGESLSELLLTVDGLPVQEVGEASYRCELLMRPRENNANTFHLHAKVSWPAPAKVENSQGSIEIVNLMEVAL